MRRWLIRIVAIGSITVCLVSAFVDAASGFTSGGSTAFNGALAILFIVVGWLLAERRPANAVGPLLLTFGACFAWYLPADIYLRLPGDPPVATFAAMFVSMLDAPMFVVLALVLILFPDGHLPSPRWWPVPWIAAASIAMTFVGAMLDGGALPLFPSYHSPLSVPGFPGQTFVYGSYALMMVLLVLGATALTIRWRRGTSTERAQVKWVVAAGLVLLVAEIINVATFRTTEPNTVTTILVSAATGLLPIAIGIAVLRYRLYAIDRIVSRGIAYGLVTAVLGVTFVGTILAVQWLLSPFTQEQTIAVAASTLVVFALFQPLRRRVQGAVDRRFDRARYDADLTVQSFAARLRDDLDLGTVRGEIVQTASAAVRPATAAVWLRGTPR